MDQPPGALDSMISLRWRLALLGKALLLLSIASGFAFLALTAVTTPDRSIVVRVVALLLCAPLSFFLAWAASLGILDALIGKSVTEVGATVLKNRKQGLSMRAPSGRSLEFILFNPWEPLRPEATYTVTYGRFSGVLVRKPEPTAADNRGN